MKVIFKLLVVVLITGACTIDVYAQKWLKNMLKSLKAKAVSYVVEPKLPTTAQLDLALPVARQVAPALRPSISTAVERQVNISEFRYILMKLEKNINELEAYSRTHGGKLPRGLPTIESRIKPGRTKPEILRADIITTILLLKGRGLTEHPLFLRYSQLSAKNKLVREKEDEQFSREFRAQEKVAEERAWQEVLLQDQAWKVQPEEIAAPAENAAKAATLGEQQLSVPGTATDEYIDQLLRFYNELDPHGTGALQ